MGCLLSAFLTESGQDVVLVDHQADRAEIIGRDGVRLEGVSGERRVRVPVTVDPGRAADAGLILVCVKAHQTEDAVRPLAGRIGPEARVLTLQNGVGNVETLTRFFGPERTWGGITALGATVLGPGRVRHAGMGDTLIGAAVAGSDGDRLAEAAEAFSLAGLPARIEADVETLIWSKLIINVGINPLTAITRLRNGQLLDFPGTERIMEEAVGEAAALAAALNITLVYPDAVARVKEVARATAGNVASMLQDVLARNRTEIDYINGAVAARGRELGLDMTVNRTLTRLVKTIEASYGQGV